MSLLCLSQVSEYLSCIYMYMYTFISALRGGMIWHHPLAPHPLASCSDTAELCSGSASSPQLDTDICQQKGERESESWREDELFNVEAHKHTHTRACNQVETLALPCIVLICIGDLNSAS